MIKKLMLMTFVTGLLLQSVFAEAVDNGNSITGSGYFDIGVTGLNLSQFKKITKEFKGREFDFDDNGFATIGMAGYAGQRRNGLRAGMGLWGGYRSTFSDEWHATNRSEISVDSVIKLHMIFLHAGLLIDKSFAVHPRVNVYGGGMLGGGVLMGVAEFMSVENAFWDLEDDDKWGDDNDDKLKIATATYWAFDVHVGATYTLADWMHVGLETYALMQVSSSGFGNRSGSFFMMSPGVRLKFIFGKSV